jgi:CspA family cold shock protein
MRVRHSDLPRFFILRAIHRGCAADTGGKGVFVHISAVEKAGLDGLPDGAKVTFDTVPNRGKESAENLRVK